MNSIKFLKNYSHFIVIGLICVALSMLNTRNASLTATNARLQKLVDNKERLIYDLRLRNDDLNTSVSELVTAVNKQNDVMKQVAEQHEMTVQQNRELQEEIKQYLFTESSQDNCQEMAEQANSASVTDHPA